jgi:hypothetical protein
MGGKEGKMAEKRATNSANKEMRDKEVGGLELDESTLMGEGTSFQAAYVWVNSEMELKRNWCIGWKLGMLLLLGKRISAMLRWRIWGLLQRIDWQKDGKRRMIPCRCKFLCGGRVVLTDRLHAMAKQRFG